MLVALLHTLDDDALACFEHIDGAPLEETDVGDFVASEEVAAIIERHHGVARDADEEVCALVGKFGYDITLPVAHTHATATVGRETSDCIERYKWNTIIAAFGNLMRYLDVTLLWYRFGLLSNLEHGTLTSQQPFCVNIELFSPKNLVFNTENCIFAAHLRLNERSKIVKKAENYKF